MQQALDLIAGVESQRPGIARNLRGKMGIEERVPEFVEEALRARHVAAGLTDVLKLLRRTTMEQLAVRFNRCSLRDDSEHVANLAADLGEEPFSISGARCAADQSPKPWTCRAAEQARSGIGHGISAGPD